jgi:hypothetical protein
MLKPGTYAFGPSDGALTVRTGKTGAAAKAGHNLVIEVGSWSAELAVGADGPTGMSLTADPRSLSVLEGTGGIQALGDEEKDSIRQTIDTDVLQGGAIAFHCTRVSGGQVDGELELRGQTHPLAFELTLDDTGHLTGIARFKQTDWGIKPYSALFGTLKVVDEIDVAIDITLPEPS